MRQYILFVLITIGLTAQLHAQQPLTWKGNSYLYELDESYNNQQHKIPYAELSLYQEDSLVQHTFADKDGYFIFDNLQAGIYDLKFEYEQLTTQWLKQISIAKDTIYDIHFLSNIDAGTLSFYPKFLQNWEEYFNKQKLTFLEFIFPQIGNYQVDLYQGMNLMVSIKTDSACMVSNIPKTINKIEILEDEALLLVIDSVQIQDFSVNQFRFEQEDGKLSLSNTIYHNHLHDGYNNLYSSGRRSSHHDTYIEGVRVITFEPTIQEIVGSYKQQINPNFATEGINSHRKNGKIPSSLSLEYYPNYYEKIESQIWEQGQTIGAINIVPAQLVHSFTYSLPSEQDMNWIDFDAHIIPCPWNEKHHLLALDIQLNPIFYSEKDTAQCLVLQINGGENQAVYQALMEVLPFMTDHDRVAILNGNHVLLEPTSVRDMATITAAFQHTSKTGIKKSAPNRQCLRYFQQQSAEYHYKFIDVELSWYPTEPSVTQEGYWREIRQWEEDRQTTFLKEQFLSCLGGELLAISDYIIQVNFDENAVRQYQLLGYEEGEVVGYPQKAQMSGYHYFFYELDLTEKEPTNILTINMEAQIGEKPYQTTLKPTPIFQNLEDWNADQTWALTMLTWGFLLEGKAIENKLESDWVFDLAKKSLLERSVPQRLRALGLMYFYHDGTLLLPALNDMIHGNELVINRREVSTDGQLRLIGIMDNIRLYNTNTFETCFTQQLDEVKDVPILIDLKKLPLGEYRLEYQHTPYKYIEFELIDKKIKKK